MTNPLSNLPVETSVRKVRPADKIYNCFVKCDGNRNEIDPHVAKLATSIKKNNCLRERPILVDKKLSIHDGHNRYQAAIRLGVPFYVVEVPENYTGMSYINQNQQNWLDRDFAVFYKSKRKKAYRIFLEYLNRFSFVTPGVLIAVLNREVRRGIVISQQFKEGKLTLKHRDHAEALLHKIAEVEHIAKRVPLIRSVFRKQQFQEALLMAFSTPSFSYEKFKKNLSDYLHDFNRLARKTDMLEHIFEIEGESK